MVSALTDAAQSQFSMLTDDVRKYVPELAGAPNKFIHAPWLLDPAAQQAAGCIIGKDYPAPVVEHDWARKLTLERYGKAKKS